MLSVIAQEINARIRENIDYIAGGLLADPPITASKPPPIPKPNLDNFLTAPPLDRQAYLQSIPPEKYGEVTGQLMSEAADRFGPMAQKLMPLFEGHQAISGLQSLLEQQAQPNLGTAAASAELTALLGFNPFEAPGQS